MKSGGSRAHSEGPTLVCFAVGEEAAPFRKVCADRTEDSILIRLTGIGRRNAERAVTAALSAGTPRRVLTCGFAGGLDPSLGAGDVVFSTSDAALEALLSRAGAKPARFFCATRIASTAAEKLELRRTTGADAVEMESEAIQAVCRGRGIPCATVRAISDPADENLPLDFNALLGPAQELEYGRLAIALMKRPGRLAGLLRLRKQSRAAAQALARVLAAVVAA